MLIFLPRLDSTNCKLYHIWHFITTWMWKLYFKWKSEGKFYLPRIKIQNQTNKKNLLLLRSILFLLAQFCMPSLLPSIHFSSECTTITWMQKRRAQYTLYYFFLYETCQLFHLNYLFCKVLITITISPN